MGQKRTSLTLFDHLVSCGEQRRRLVRLSAFVVLRLITSSYSVGACTETSAGTR